MLRRISVMVAISLLPTFVAHASPGDVFNLTAPAWHDPGNGNRWLLARKSDGTYWRAQQAINSPWGQFSGPTGGGSSGPVAATFEYPSQDFYMIRGASPDPGNCLTTASYGVSWSNLFGLPPGGSTSAPALVGTYLGTGNVVVLGPGNVPFWRQRASDGTFQSWTQVGSAAVASAPGIAMNQWRIDIFTLRAGGAIRMQTDEYPTAFSPTSTWTDVPGGGVGISTPNAAWLDQTATDGPFLAVVVLGTNAEAFVNTFDNMTQTWTGWVARGGSFTSSVAIIKGVNGDNTPWLAGRGQNGQVYVNHGGTTWTQYGIL
jgi:hypothetical protein